MMKLIIIGCLQELRQDVAKLLNQAGVEIFSVSETTGFRRSNNGNLLDDWFGKEDSRYDSLIFFSFIDESTAARAMLLVNEYNSLPKNSFPLKAFIIPVESSSQNS